MVLDAPEALAMVTDRRSATDTATRLLSTALAERDRIGHRALLVAPPETFGSIVDGSDLSIAGVEEFSLDFVPDAANVESVKFELSGPVNKVKTENVAPYALFGNNGNNFLGVDVQPGSYTLRIRAYSGNNRTGTLITDETITFTLTT